MPMAPGSSQDTIHNSSHPVPMAPGQANCWGYRSILRFSSVRVVELSGVPGDLGPGVCFARRGGFLPGLQAGRRADRPASLPVEKRKPASLSAVPGTGRRSPKGGREVLLVAFLPAPTERRRLARGFNPWFTGQAFFASLRDAVTFFPRPFRPHYVVGVMFSRGFRALANLRRAFSAEEKAKASFPVCRVRHRHAHSKGGQGGGV